MAASGSDHAKLSQIFNPHSSKSLQLNWLSLQQEQQSAGKPAPSSFRARARLREQHTTSAGFGCVSLLQPGSSCRSNRAVTPPSEPPCYRNDAWAWVSAWAWVDLG